MFDADIDIKTKFLKIMLASHEGSLAGLQKVLEKAQAVETHSEKDDGDDEGLTEKVLSEWMLEENLDPIGSQSLIARITKAIGTDVVVIDGKDSSFYLITEGVLKPAEMIKLNENFTTTLFNKVKPGKYTYLLGRNTMLRFVRKDNVIKGFYFNDAKEIGFEFGFDLETGEYYAPNKNIVEFSQMVQIMTFVELGDIEIVVLNSNQHNGKPKKDGKIMNSSRYSVYVVDSTWNQMLIRTEGFAVRGHFRLQPCGVAMSERKLIWISAFEKEGYRRRPKAEIVK